MSRKRFEQTAGTRLVVGYARLVIASIPPLDHRHHHHPCHRHHQHHHHRRRRQNDYENQDQDQNCQHDYHEHSDNYEKWLLLIIASIAPLNDHQEDYYDEEGDCLHVMEDIQRRNKDMSVIKAE